MTCTTKPSYLSLAEVADLLRVPPKRVALWTADKRLRAARTPHGQLRFHSGDVARLRAELLTRPEVRF